MRVFGLVAAAIVAAALVGVTGCISIPGSDRASGAPLTPGSLTLAATWGPWQDDPMPHLLLTISHHGDLPVSVGPGADPIVVTGPHGLVPISWGSMLGAQTLRDGDSISLALHPRADADGNFTLSMDHAWGTPLRGEPGMYFVCVADGCANARLS